MKSCPDCNRTFDDTMTFCLVDGSILSAPFDPNSTPHSATRRDPDPAPTEMIHRDLNSPETTPAPQNDRDTTPPQPTIASPTPRTQPQAETPTLNPENHSSTREVVAQSAMKTMKAPPPDVVFSDKQRVASRGETSPDRALRQTDAAGGKRAALIAGIVVAVILIGGIVWLIQRARTWMALRGTAQSEQAKQKKDDAQPTGQSFTEKVAGVQIQMVSVPGGTFLMGSPLSEKGRDKDEGPQHSSTVQGFYMSKYELTQEQYKAVTQTNPSSFKGDSLPVDSVSWNDAVEFCRQLTEETGRAYRLPTEAEWEYACRAGTNGPYAGNLDKMAWYGANSGNQTHPVGQREPNGFGLYDMYGNVWEWCQSKYQSYPYQATDGRENVQDNDLRVMRGGSWESAASSSRSAYRRRIPPDARSIGFRIVLVAQ